VFTPDIHYTNGNPGRSAANYVVAAAEHLKKMPWVDDKHIGIQGHSFGGYETNSIITQTDVFAAAMSGAGMSNLVSNYGELMHRGGVAHGRMWAEVGQGRIIKTLWEQPDLYIKNSPVFYTHNVTTPLLMMNNKEDGIVNFSQGVEFFTGLRRLGKKAWMLQYDGKAHSIIDEKTQRDYTIRITQFFDHYLKGKPAPVWMTRGIAAKDKTLKTGYEFDTEIKTPGDGLLRPEQKTKVFINY
jgi:dipeptidyl aminopeptidase/acylaminoacyl peptidase